MEKSSSDQQLQVKIADEVLQGVYANLAQVAHTPEEFFIDFMNVLPPHGIVGARVIMSPAHFKRMVAAMQDNLQRYEAEFGAVGAPALPEKKIGFKTE
ncbi:MAG TPA: DUF3467 domain-containing protein [Patescibacteria group bacterium]|nr:DUF3467 domain-containing protein [Patescibacteria group bacterium]